MAAVCVEILCGRGISVCSEHSLSPASVIKYVTPPHLALVSWLTVPNRTGADTADVNSELNCYMTELQDRAPLQAQTALQFWLDCESSYQRLRLPQLALDLCHTLPHKPMLRDSCHSVVNRRRESITKPGCPSIGVFLELNRHILHWTGKILRQVWTDYWYSREAQDILWRGCVSELRVFTDFTDFLLLLLVLKTAKLTKTVTTAFLHICIAAGPWVCMPGMAL